MPTYEEEQDLLLEQALQQHQQQVEAAATVQPPQQQAPVEPGPQAEPAAAKTPRQVAQTTEVQSRPAGLATEVGNWWNSLNRDDVTDQEVAKTNSFIQSLPDSPITTPLKRAFAEVDRLTLGKEEKNTLFFALVDKAKNLLINIGADKEATESLATFVTGQKAIEMGAEAGARNIVPSTIAGLMGEDDPWNQAPEAVKQTRGGERLFEIAREVAPSLVLGAATGGGGLALTGGKGLLQKGGLAAAEAAVETSAQSNVDDTLLGRRVAGDLATWAESQGLDGNALARELTEGSTGRATMFIKTIGFMENLGLNFGVEALKAVGGKLWGQKANQLGGNVEEAAQILKRPVDDIVQEIDNGYKPDYSVDFEPTDSMTTMSAVQAPKPSAGNKYINEPAMIADALRRNGLDADGLTQADSKFFTDLSKITDKAGAQKVIEEATRPLARMVKGFRGQKQVLIDRAKIFWEENGWLADAAADIPDTMGALRYHFTNDLTELTPTGRGVALLGSTDENLLKNWTQVNQTGFIVAPLILEKLGVHAQKIARQVGNLDAIGVDFMPHVEKFVTLHSSIQEFAVPLARAKAAWNLSGNAQTRRLRGLAVDNADIKASQTGKAVLDQEAPFEAFTTIYKGDGDVGATLNDLLYRYKNGDVDAGNTLKQYMNLIAYGNPRTASQQITHLSSALADQLKKGNTKAVGTLYYASMLTNIGTHAVSAVSGLLRIITDPIGAVASGNRAYGLGQVAGMMSAKDEIWGIIRRSWTEGRTLTGGSKFDTDVLDLKLLQKQAESAYEGLQKDMVQKGSSWLETTSAMFGHNYRMWALHPFNGAAARALTAVDDGLKVMYASGIGSGLAFKEAAELGIKQGTPEFDKLLKAQMNDVFIDGIKNGEISPKYLPNLKNVTFQNDIPVDGNFVDGAFKWMEDGSKNNAVAKVMAPFPRVSYNALESTARYEPTGLLRTTVPRYKAILAGEMGEVAQIQLKSQIAFGRIMTGTTAMLASAGLVTGYNSGDMPQTSFIIPKPGGGYFHFDYGRFPPFSTIIALTADSVNGVRDEVISEGEYGKYIMNMVYSLGMASFDQTFLSGMLRFSSLMDVKNMSEARAVNVGRLFTNIAVGVTGGGVAGLARTAGRVIQPNQTITDDSNVYYKFWNILKSQMTGGASQPVLHDQLTGEPMPKSNMFGNQSNWFLQSAAGLVGQIIPGYSGQSDRSRPLVKELNFLNYEADESASIRMVKNTALTADEQSILSRDIALVGKLPERLEKYFASDRYKKLKAQYQALRVRENPIAMVDDRGKQILQTIHTDLNNLRNQAKEIAVREGELGNNSTGLLTRIQLENVPLGDMSNQPLNPLQSVVQDLIAIPK